MVENVAKIVNDNVCRAQDMNIFLVCHVYPPEHAPAGVIISELAEDLVKCGHRVTVITGFPSHPGGPLYPGWKASLRQVEDVPEGFRLVRCCHSFHPRNQIIWKLWYYLTFALSSFWGGLRSGKADVIVILSTPIFGGLTCVLLAMCKRAKSLYWIYDVHPEASRNAGFLRDNSLVYRFFRAIDTFVCRRTTLVATLSEPMRQLVLARGLPPQKAIVLSLWVDPRKIVPGARDNAWRREHGVGLDKFIVLCAGTIGFISGAEVIIDAAERLRHRQDIYFLIVGEGPVKEKLIDKSRQYGLQNVKFLSFQPADVLSEVQATGDVGLVTLLPSTGESSVPSKMFGYTAAARPVIASVAADTPTAEMVREGQFGIVCPPQDAQALADAICQLADDHAKAEQMGCCAREFFVREFGREKCVCEAERILIECMVK